MATQLNPQATVFIPIRLNPKAAVFIPKSHSPVVAKSTASSKVASKDPSLISLLDELNLEIIDNPATHAVALSKVVALGPRSHEKPCLSNIPNEILLEIFKKLPTTFSVTLGLTCKNLYVIHKALHGKVCIEKMWRYGLIDVTCEITTCFSFDNLIPRMPQTQMIKVPMLVSEKRTLDWYLKDFMGPDMVYDFTTQKFTSREERDRKFSQVMSHECILRHDAIGWAYLENDLVMKLDRFTWRWSDSGFLSIQEC